MASFSFVLPADFAEYEWEAEAKGWFSGATMIISGKRYQLNFYDPVRLSQEIESELERGDVFFEPNLVVVKSVTGSSMAQAARQLVESDRVRFLAPD